jgi:KDO2-lipid IV(A) lauroyltransferase
MADANLLHFVPDLDARRRKELIAEVFFQQRMALRDYSDHGLIETTRVADLAGLFGAAASTTPRIYCTYHVGSYRHFFHFLARAGVDAELLLAGKTLELQGDSIRRGGNKDWPGRLGMINAEASNSLLSAARALKRGRSVVIYIDGNSGVGSNWENDRMQPVRFFDKTLLARTGIAYLSHLSGVPIVPVTCKRDEAASLTLTLHPALTPDGLARDAYVRDTTAELYALLEREIAATPGQWEGWLYVHKFLQKRQLPAGREMRRIPDVRPGALLAANLERFAVLVFGEQPVLLDKQRHSFSMTDESAAEVFRMAAATGGFPADSRLDQAHVQRLLESGALTLAGY